MSSTWILVVDDDDDIRDTLTMLLELRGYDAVGASDGLDALKVIRSRGRPGMILLDMMMPNMNGEEFAAALHQDRALAPSPIVVFSGDPNAHELARAVGAQGLVKKPADFPAILAMVQRLVPAGPSART